MKRIASFAIAALALSLAGCSPSGGEEVSPQSAPIDTQSAQARDKDTHMVALKPPSPDSILYFVYERDGDGAHSFEVDGGDIISYWFGHAFDFGGRHYFTGFTARSAGPESDSTTMEPGHVAVGQATLVQVDKGGLPAWSQLATDGYVGEFGRNDQPDAIDESRRPESHDLGDGRLLLAVPTRQFDDGIAATGFAMFLFDPDNVDSLAFRTWGYVGTIPAGSDNSAACEGGVLTCAVSTGAMSLETDPGSQLPAIRVTLSGEAVAGPGQVRSLGPTDAAVFKFDANAGQYQP